MYRLWALALILGLFAISVAQRLWRTPDAWWNWAALAALGLGAGATVLAYMRRRAVSSPRWYNLRPGVVAVVAVIGLTGWFVVRVPAPMGHGPAGPAVSAEAFSQTWSTRQIELMSLGDSVSTGYGAPKGHGYFDLIRQNNAETYPEMQGLDLSSVLPRIRVTRLASNSTNSIEHLGVIERLQSRGEDTFGIVCITTGGIDLIHYYGKAAPKEGAMYGATLEQAEPWISNFRDRLDAMVLALAAKFPGGCVVMLATIYEPTDDVGDIENAGPLFWLPKWRDGRPIHGGFNDAIKDCAATHAHVHLVDVYRVMLGHGIHCRDRANPYYDADDPSYWFYSNLEDPNQRGYDAIRRVFLNAIIKALDEHPAFDVPHVQTP